MRNARAETAVGLVLEDRPLDLARLAARRPAALAAAWGGILLALAAADGIDTGALLDALRPCCAAPARAGASTIPSTPTATAPRTGRPSAARRPSSTP